MGAVPLSHVPVRWLRVHGSRRVLSGVRAPGGGFYRAIRQAAGRCEIRKNGELPPMRIGWRQIFPSPGCDRRAGIHRPGARACQADGVQPPRATWAPRSSSVAQRGPTDFRGAVILTCRPMSRASTWRHWGEHRLVACLPGGGGVVPKSGASRGIVAAFGPVSGPPPGSEAKVLMLSQIPQRPRGLSAYPPDVDALRGPRGPLFRCPFPSGLGDVGDRNTGSATIRGRFRPPCDSGSPGIRSPNRAAGGARAGGQPRSPAEPKGARLCVLNRGALSGRPRRCSARERGCQHVRRPVGEHVRRPASIHGEDAAVARQGRTPKPSFAWRGRGRVSPSAG